MITLPSKIHLNERHVARYRPNYHNGKKDRTEIELKIGHQLIHVVANVSVKKFEALLESADYVRTVRTSDIYFDH
jgi:hypothetical protein